MTTRARTPNFDAYDHLNNGALTAGKMTDPSPLANASGLRPTSAAFSYVPGDDLDDDDVGPSVQQLEGAGLHRTASSSSRAGAGNGVVSRSNTLKKQSTLSRKTSLKRSNSRKSLAAGSIKGVQVDDRKYAPGDEYNSAFYCPVPTTGSPTEILANRFQTWRKFLKDLIAYFKEVQNSYEQRSKALLKVANVINNTQAPSIFLADGGLSQATRILRDYHRQANAEANKAREIEEDVITQLSGLRADLGQKIKEIKSLSGDFKNSVEKEKDHTRRAVNGLQEALAVVDRDAAALVGKEDPYIIKLSVDRQIERQIDEENYLHRAYLNLEGSGRELESIVVGEVQKAYNALAGILKREADEAYNAVDSLRSGPVTIAKDLEWTSFINTDSHFISADTPLRKVENIEYPGKNHPAAAEVRAGMLERKSKYLKSYTPGWYVLSPTHLHEFKSADRIYSQPPVMSLLLADQKLGSHSQPGSSSHKFMLKGRQTGSMHRGHSWVFRAETYDTMLAWYDDIQALTEKTGEERNAFVRKHARTFSSGSRRTTGSVDGDSALDDDDEADDVPFSTTDSLVKADADGAIAEKKAPTRPEPGGRFPSELLVTSGHLSKSFSRSSGGSTPEQDLDRTATTDTDADAMMMGALRPATDGDYNEVGRFDTEMDHFGDAAFPLAAATTSATVHRPPVPYVSPTAYQTHNPTYETPALGGPETIINNAIPPTQGAALPPSQDPFLADGPSHLARHSSDYGSWMAPTGVAAGLGAAGYFSSMRHTEIEPEPPIPETVPTVVPPTIPNPIIAEIQTSHGAVVAATTPDPDSVPQTHSPLTTSAQSVLSDSTAPTELEDSPAASQTHLSHTAYDTDKDGAVIASPTGTFFPKILRHDTDTSISNLHVPGGFF